MLQKGRSLHIGLNHVDTAAYQAQGLGVPELAGCINDARAMQQLAADQGFVTQSLIDDQATSQEVIRLIASYAMELVVGDAFFLTFSGHGGQVDDVNGDEDDRQDETWVLWDRMLIDDELFHLFSQFQNGVRIIMLSDSCHSGTVAKMILNTAINQQYRTLAQSLQFADATFKTKDIIPGVNTSKLSTDDLRKTREIDALTRATASSAPKFRGLTDVMSREIYTKSKRVYDTFQFLSGRTKDADFAPSLILISGCQDSQLSQDGNQNGLFTENLLKVWDSGNFSGDYQKLWQEIGSRMPPSQTPNFFTLGDVTMFQQQRPFKIVTEQFDPSGSALPVMKVLGAATRSRSDSAPNFQIDTAGAPYYIVEFATEIDLFDSEHHDSGRTTENFWASWSESPVFTAGNGFYPMPNSVWDNLKQADQIYFRVGTTSTQDGWQDYRVSVPDEATEGPSLSMAA